MNRRTAGNRRNPASPGRNPRLCFQPPLPDSMEPAPGWAEMSTGGEIRNSSPTRPPKCRGSNLPGRNPPMRRPDAANPAGRPLVFPQLRPSPPPIDPRDIGHDPVCDRPRASSRSSPGSHCPNRPPPSPRRSSDTTPKRRRRSHPRVPVRRINLTDFLRTNRNPQLAPIKITSVGQASHINPPRLQRTQNELVRYSRNPPGVAHPASGAKLASAFRPASANAR